MQRTSHFLRRYLWLKIVLLSLVVLVFWMYGGERKLSLEEALVEQFQGKACHYIVYNDYTPFSTCHEREVSFMEHAGVETIRHQKEVCFNSAVRCMGIHKISSTVPLLISALETTSDLQTCDGIITLRTDIVKALGNIGDKRALKPLEQYLQSDARQKYATPNMNPNTEQTHCFLNAEPKEHAIEAIRKIEAANTATK